MGKGFTLRGSLTALTLLAMAGCSDLGTESPLSHARTSPEALAAVALEAVAEQNDSLLNTLLITREEYETLLWPVMPDKETTPFEFVWGMAAPRSRKARGEVMSDFQGIPLELVKVDLGDEIEAYDEFTFYRDARMTVRRTDTGEEGIFPLMDVLVVMDGGWKFMNFKDDA